MKKIIKILAILGIVTIYSLSLTFNINNTILHYLNILFISAFIFFEGNNYRSFNKNKYISDIIRLFFIYFFFNVSYLVFTKGILIKNDILIDIIKDTLTLKNVIFDLFAAMLICNLFRIFIKKKKVLTVIEILLIPMFIYFKNEYIIYIIVFNFSLLLNRINIKNVNKQMINILNDSYITIYIFNKIILYLLLNINLVNYNNLSDLIGIIVLSYLFGTISKIYLSYLPIIRKLI